jgi:hypothetical protein
MCLHKYSNMWSLAVLTIYCFQLTVSNRLTYWLVYSALSIPETFSTLLAWYVNVITLHYTIQYSKSLY